MKINLKKELGEAFTPPVPKRRERFLTALPYPKLTYPDFVLSQVGYIRKRIWLFSLLILMAGIGTVCLVPDSSMLLVWILSALIPFLAVLTAAEISRSDIFGMSEIESGCKFALPQVIGARMIILGICNFAVIAAMSAVLGIFSAFGIAKAALYILTPYVLVNGISLSILGKVQGQEGVFLCAAAALAVAMAGMILLKNGRWDEGWTNLWMTIVCTAGVVLTMVQNKKLLIGKDKIYGTQN